MKKEKEEKMGIGKKHIIVFLVGVLLLSGAVSYAYFTAQTKSTGAGITTVSQTVSYEGTELVTNGVLEFNDTGILPGHQNISSVSVTATGIESVIYNLNWTGTNSLQTPLTYTVYKTDTEVEVSVTCDKKTETNNGTTKYYEECTENGFDNLVAVGSGTIGTYETQTKIPLVINEEITATREGTTVYYYVVLEYPNLNESQNYDMGGSFSGVVNTEILGEKEMPVVTLSEEYTEANNGWYSSVTVTARATNSNNTVSSINSCITTEEECTPESDVTRSIGIEKSVTLNESNKNAQKVCFQGVDSKGTKGLIVCSNSYLIDNTSTTTSITLSDSSVLGSNNWYQSATLNITGNNEVSGISSIKYCVTSNDICEPTTTVSGSSASVTLESSATGQKVCATSTDNKGTTSEIACSNLYNVDNEKPEVTLSEDIIMGSSEWSTKADITAIGTDKISGINKLVYCTTSNASCTPIEEVSASTYIKKLESNTTATKVCFKAVDIVGNESEIKCSDAYKVDKDAPTNNSVIINSGSATANSTSVTLTLSSNGASEMCISNTTSCSNYVPYVTSYNWVLLSGEGTKTVYVYFKDPVGNVSSVVTDSINFTPNVPTNNRISIDNDATYTNSTSVTLTLSSTGASQVCISNTPSCSNYVTYYGSYNWTLASGDGQKTVYAYFKSADGGISSVVSDTIRLDTTPPVITLTATSTATNITLKVSTNETIKNRYTYYLGSTVNQYSSMSNTYNYSTSKHSISSGNTYTVGVIVEDLAGNSANKSIRVTLEDS